MEKKKIYLISILAIALISIGLILLSFGLLLGDKLNNWFPIFIGLGISFVPSGIITNLIRVFLSKEMSLEINNSIEKVMKSEFLQFHDLNTIKEQGIRSVKDSFPKKLEIKDLISESITKIDILNTWIPNIADFKKAIFKAMNQNCKIGILILSQDSNLVEYRAAQLGETKQEVINKLHETIRFYRSEFRNDSKKDFINIEMREFDELFGLSVYRFDDELFTGWFWSHENNIYGPYLRVKHSSFCQFSKAIEDHFNKICKNAKPV